MLTTTNETQWLQSGEASQHSEKNGSPTTLFVFGDSYVDTGNVKIDEPGSWKDPYGITFPGKPSGRFSDGRVLTDYIAKYLGLKSPAPYKFRRLMRHRLKYGINFAYAGTGVFSTMAKRPNMTTQIDFLEQLIKENVYTTSDLSKSVAYLSVCGNDYTYFMINDGSAEGFPPFIASMVNQTAINMHRIQSLGVGKVAVGGIHPLGCLPPVTGLYSYKECNKTLNDLIVRHNNALNEAVTKLNQQAKDHSTFFVFDLYGSFMSVLNHPSDYNIKEKFKACCDGLSMKYICGSMENNVKKYRVEIDSE
ncbi:unnamed protein product [Sphenostylis stenocarpa]|uniref:Uncharacterized protein n=1 Tax=Sphenostylis stenocarpa TaxID=92480 RepID=A0AA86SWP5_9FABA|nr:unnamed protein product [Sphenostylis stenocarpa]